MEIMAATELSTKLPKTDQEYLLTLETDVNGTFNTTYDNGILYEVPTGLVVILAMLYGAISILAVLGNGLVILVIVKNKRMQTVTNLFISNLAVADVITGMFAIPFQFQAALLQQWIFAHFLCSLAPFVLTMSVSVSVLTLTVIAVDRYFAVLHPLKQRFTKRTAVILVTAIWIICSTSSLPEALFRKVIPIYPKPLVFCTTDWPTHPPNFAKAYHLYLLFAQYLLPLVIISFAYLRIGCHIWMLENPGIAVNNQNDIRSRNKRKVVKMLLVVVCLFVICWMPLQTYNLLSEIWRPINEYKASIEKGQNKNRQNNTLGYIEHILDEL
ncbi:neuropeptide Y receptor type 2-like isoform X2 [Octopus sinensis]|uniref:Neuropeptide Y receptor type 2-like isoform X2 n=1 Tax=Octopus sinensis TaxID=2607531 RepID=A0A7E6ESC7_9MOLL|nr:neuropeptide Y receptor type 2-like isoform X2 [Octopus sinensis]